MQWLGGTPSQRQAIVGVLAAEVGGPSTTGGRGSTLTDAQAATLFAHTCASPVARHFLLYEPHKGGALSAVLPLRVEAGRPGDWLVRGGGAHSRRRGGGP